MSRSIKPADEPRFANGNKVRVKPKTVDPDFPDFPIGGWVGEVVEVNPSSKPIMYLVEWTEETLDQAHPVYFLRCERNGLETDHSWLPEQELVLDQGEPLNLEQPTKLKPAPLDDDIPEDRIRRVFNLTSDDSLPDMTVENLNRYREYLEKKLRFPVPLARATLLNSTAGTVPLAVVTRLLPVEETDNNPDLLAEISIGNETDIVPFSDLDSPPGSILEEEQEAYDGWIVETRGFWNDSLPDLITPASVFSKLGVLTLAVALLGALVGAALAVFPDVAWLAIKIGSGTLGLLGLGVGFSMGRFIRRFDNPGSGARWGMLLGGLLGLLCGGIIGVLVICYVGVIPGAIAGSILGQILSSFGIQNIQHSRLTLLGAYVGTMIFLFSVEVNQALVGSAQGAGIALGAGLVLVVLALGFWAWLTRK